MLRVHRAGMALRSLWHLLRARSRDGRYLRPDVHHRLCVHVHELRHFVIGIEDHALSYACHARWHELHASLECAESLTELRAVHGHYVTDVLCHCDLTDDRAPTANAIGAVLGLVLALHRDVSVVSEVAPIHEEMIDASERQFALLMKALAPSWDPARIVGAGGAPEG